MTTIAINIDGRKLAAIAILAAKADVRYYLTGVYVEATATQTRLAATNGRYLGMHGKCNPLDDNEGCEWETLILPPDVIAKCKPVKNTPSICTVLIGGPQIGNLKRIYTMRLWDGTLIPFDPIDGVFPDLRRVVPAMSPSGIGVQLNPEYLGLFVKVNKALGAKTPHFISLGFDGPEERVGVSLIDPDFVGVIMSMRGDYVRGNVWPDKGADPVPEATDEVPASEHEAEA